MGQLTFADPVVGTTGWGTSLNGILDTIKSWSQLVTPPATIGAEVDAGPTSAAEITLMTAVIPANLVVPGTTFNFRVFANHQSQAASGTLTFRMYYGANSQSVVWPTTAGAQAATSAQFDGHLTVRATGAGGTFLANGLYVVQASVTTVNWFGSQNTATAAVDTTVNQTLKLTVQWQTSSATNIFKALHGYIGIQSA